MNHHIFGFCDGCLMLVESIIESWSIVLDCILKAGRY